MIQSQDEKIKIPAIVIPHKKVTPIQLIQEILHLLGFVVS